MNVCNYTAVQRLQQLVAGFSLRKTGIDTRLVHVGFVVDKVALAQDFLRVLWFDLSVLFHHCFTVFYHYNKKR
jgi:hypothetical protein